EPMFEAIWQRLTLAQRAVLRAVVIQGGREVLSADVRTRHRLGGTSKIQSAISALVRDGVISREGGREVVVYAFVVEGVRWHYFWVIISRHLSRSESLEPRAKVARPYKRSPKGKKRG